MSASLYSAPTALLDRQQADGAWGAVAGVPGDLESTALALLALDPAGPAWASGRAWLAERQKPSGAFPHSDAVPADGWATPLAALALSASPADVDAARDAAGWTVARDGRPPPWYARVLFRLFPGLNPIEQDFGLVGWPWTEETFSWVEPTAYAMIALRRLGILLPEEGREAAIDRIREGERLLLDRQCPGGGWNYGNSRVLDEDLWPYPDTTALALLALRGEDARSAIEDGFRAMEATLRTHHSILALALAAIALRAHGRDAAGVRARLAARLEEAPPRDTRSLALAIQALDPRTPPLAGRG